MSEGKVVTEKCGRLVKDTHGDAGRQVKNSAGITVKIT